ncbi:unnamed protein product [Agarophyton chilense]
MFPDGRANLKASADVIDDYHIITSADVIKKYAKGNTFHVALQFPDDMLHFGPYICESLRLLSEAYERDRADQPTISYFLLGDTSYGECCVDEVAAQHLACDLVVHYGSACLSPTRTLPVLYVFPKIALENPELACAEFRKSIQDLSYNTKARRIAILYDLDLESCFTSDGFQAGHHQTTLASLDVVSEIHIAALRIPNAHAVREPGYTDTSERDSEIMVGPHVVNLGDVPANETVFIWYTRCDEEEVYSPLLRNAVIQLCSGASNSSRMFFAVSFSRKNSGSVQLIEPSKILRKRFAAVGKILEAERIGIIPGTLGVSGNTDIIERCKQLVSFAGKRPYVILVGKPNPVKLANYPEIDVFVLVACPLNGLIDDKEYLRPIVTPFELEAAVLREGDIFSAPYTMDFQQLLKEKIRSSDLSENEMQVINRSDEWSLTGSNGSGGADYLKKRHWQGLKYGEGGSDDNTIIEQLPTHIEVGDSGIASGYRREQA